MQTTSKIRSSYGCFFPIYFLALVTLHLPPTTAFELDTKLTDYIGGFLNQYEPDLQNVQTGNEIHYGCWCHFTVEQLGADETKYKFQIGRGSPVDELDRMCQVLAKGYRCVFIDSDFDRRCEPWTVEYSGGSGTMMECDDDDDGEIVGECKSRTCYVETGFVHSMYDMAARNVSIDSFSYGHNSTFDFASECPHVPPKDHTYQECCGDYPDRYTYTTDGTEQCCGHEVYDSGEEDCCVDTNNVVDKGEVCETTTQATTSEPTTLEPTTLEPTTLDPPPPIYDATYEHSFKFDGRPTESLYDARTEVKLCTCGEYDCQEQDSMKEMFANEQRPSFEQYTDILEDPNLSTSVENSVITVVDSPSSSNHFSVSITSKNGYNTPKTQGGDYWIVRLIASKDPTNSKSVKQIIIPPVSSTNFKDGSYSFELPFLPESYTENLNFTLEVWLERSAEMMEVNRRAMSSYSMVGRQMPVHLPLIGGGTSLGYCGMFPLENSCNFSASLDRSYYCYAENADCEQPVEIFKGASQVFRIAEVVEECSTGMFTKEANGNIIEDNFQKLAFAVNYTEIDVVNSQNRLFPVSADAHFKHWCYGRHVTEVQDLTLFEEEIDLTTKAVFAYGNVFPISDQQLSEFYQYMRNRTILFIGDSLMNQQQEFMEKILNENEEFLEKTYVDFWGEEHDSSCPTNRYHDFQQSYKESENIPVDENDTAEVPTFTKFAFFPHGKPLHHGGCSKQRTPWMVDTIARVEQYADLNDRTLIIIDPAAHFAIANPAYLFNRLLELKTVLVAFKARNPEVRIVFRTPNYWPGNFYEQISSTSAMNARWIEKIYDELFGNSELFEVVKVYERTDYIFDQFGGARGGLHPGVAGGAKWIENEIVRWTLGL